MNRRNFLKNTTIGLATLGWPLSQNSQWNDVIIGHGSFKYKVDLNWGKLNTTKYPVKDCHEMVIDKKGRVILLTNHTKNNVLIYNSSGRLIKSWGNSYPGAHGLTLMEEGGEEFLYITDTKRHEVIKTTLSGREIMVLPYPKEKYDKADQYLPTETAIDTNGDIFVADGYGLQYILHYSSKGELLNSFGGRGETEAHLDNAHGICLDHRFKGPSKLLVTDRMKNQLKTYSLDGKLLEVKNIPGAYICRPVIKGMNVFLATIWSGHEGKEEGFISILDKENFLISAPGGISPEYIDQELSTMHQSLKIFQHPHDVCIDKDENLYVAQWNSGQTYPIKLTRI